MSGNARTGLRDRLMLIVVAVVALGLTLSGIGLYVALAVSVSQRIDADARASAETVAALVASNRLPEQLPVSGSQLIQVVDAQGRVIAASAGADRLTPMVTPAELGDVADRGPQQRPGHQVGVNGPVRVSVLRVTQASDGAPADSSVVVAVPVKEVLATRSTLRTALLVALPALLTLLAATAWWVIGRTLRPVEALRAGADRIRESGSAEERLPVPEASDEIHALAVTLNGMLDRLAAERVRQRMFVADAAHELRTPLTTLRTEIEVSAMTGAAQPETATILLAELERLTSLVEDLLLLARAEADPRSSTPDEIEVTTLLADVARTYRGRAASTAVDVHAPPIDAAGPGDGLVVRADPGQLRRVVTNLVDNAVRHARSRVDLAAERVPGSSPGEILITVTDDGAGIPVADRKRVFDRFTRLDESRQRDSGGSGLGLAIVRDLVTRAGGTVSFGTDPTVSRAEVRLPAAPGQ